MLLDCCHYYVIRLLSCICLIIHAIVEVYEWMNECTFKNHIHCHNVFLHFRDGRQSGGWTWHNYTCITEETFLHVFFNIFLNASTILEILKKCFFLTVVKTVYSYIHKYLHINFFISSPAIHIFKNLWCSPLIIICHKIPTVIYNKKGT